MDDKIKEVMKNQPILARYGVHLGPEIVNLSLISFICNGCEAIYCPIWKNATNDNLLHIMHIKDAFRIINGLSEFQRIPVLRLLPHGELSSYPHIPEFVNMIKKFEDRFPLVANTNGLYLDELEPLLSLLTILEISINANSEKEYMKLRTASQPGDFEKITEKVKAIAKKINEKTLRLKLVVSFLRYPGINDQADDWNLFKKTWSNYGVEPVLRDLHSFSGHIRSLKLETSIPHQPCKSLFTRMTIASNGSFLRCYNDIDSTDVIGKIGENTSLSDLWYSKNNLDGMLIMLGLIDGKTFCSTCYDRVCADPSTDTGHGDSFESYARGHHAEILRSKK